MISVYEIGTRNSLIEKGIPQFYSDELIENEELKISIGMVYDESTGGEIYGVSLEIDGFALDTRVEGKGTVCQRGKYGAWESETGVIYLGIDDESIS